jgi:hypothetical protein
VSTAAYGSGGSDYGSAGASDYGSAGGSPRYEDSFSVTDDGNFPSNVVGRKVLVTTDMTISANFPHYFCIN